MKAYIVSAALIKPEISEESEFLMCQTPDCSSFVPAGKLRRMNRLIKTALFCAHESLQKAGIKVPDAVIAGTGLGCLEDTEKFLDNVHYNREKLLNPTAFIQSTHNTVAGQIALITGCKDYNFTFSQKGFSFESALCDALIQVHERPDKMILTGGIDIHTEKVHKLMEQGGCLSERTLGSKGKIGEGAAFFILSGKPHPMARAVICEQIYAGGSIPIERLFQKMDLHSLKPEDIHLYLPGGKSAEYQSISSLFPQADTIHYTEQTGRFDTASSVALAVADKSLSTGQIPTAFLSDKQTQDSPQNALIHSYHPEYEHAFTLIKKRQKD